MNKAFLAQVDGIKFSFCSISACISSVIFARNRSLCDSSLSFKACLDYFFQCTTLIILMVFPLTQNIPCSSYQDSCSFSIPVDYTHFIDKIGNALILLLLLLLSTLTNCFSILSRLHVAQ